MEKRQPQHAAKRHQEELASSNWNTRIAVMLTKAVGTMWTAYIFVVLALIGLFGLLGWLNPFVFLLATWTSQQFLQLVFLPILSVGQNVLNRHNEIQSEEQYHATLNTYQDSEEVKKLLTDLQSTVSTLVEILLEERQARKENGNGNASQQAAE
ncbi:MAG TPA: hypothetical protein VH593_15675 [Ktedonobacteraceae bacterium]|jgi:uncharacterized membrane protein